MSYRQLSQAGNYIEAHKIERILLIKLTSLGDVVHALPVAAALKRTFPLIRLYWVVEDRCAPLLENHPLLDSVIVYPRQEIQTLMSKRKWGQVLKRLKNLRRTLKNLNIDLSIDLQGLAKSGLMALMAGAPHRFGCSGLKEMSYLISRRIPEEKGLHVVDSNLKTAEFLGAKTEAPEFIIEIKEEEKTRAKEFLKKSGVVERDWIIGLQMGTVPPQKCWPPAKYRSFIEQVSKLPNTRLILFGDKTDQETLLPHLFKIPPKVINTAGNLSLRQLMALIAQCHVFVGGDSGPLHLAAGLGLPVIALFGGTDPGWSRPYGSFHTVLYKLFSCSPCLLTPNNKPPVCQGRYDCMEAIEVDEVLVSVQAVLESSGRWSRSSK
jgi:heptosyltransferase-1